LQTIHNILNSDAELIQQYKVNADLNVLGKLYAPYMDLVYGVCLKYFKEPEDAKDAVINIFEELVQKTKKYEIENFKGWLHQLAKNHCLMKLRSQKNQPKKVEVDFVYLEENTHLEDIIEKENNLNSLENCINSLPKEQQDAIRLFYLQEKCYKEIAEQTALEITKVRSYIQNGRRNLKICMENTALQKAN
jgi:RNA polymerase sigma factor (sigma-70 family)